jgi:hypothetical protein
MALQSPVPFSGEAATVGLLLFLSVQGCSSTDTKPIYGPDRVMQQIDTGFTGDLSVGATMGHTVPPEGEIISTPPCVGEARTGQECK